MQRGPERARVAAMRRVRHKLEAQTQQNSWLAKIREVQVKTITAAGRKTPSAISRRYCTEPVVVTKNNRPVGVFCPYRI